MIPFTLIKIGGLYVTSTGNVLEVVAIDWSRKSLQVKALTEPSGKGSRLMLKKGQIRTIVNGYQWAQHVDQYTGAPPD